MNTAAAAESVQFKQAESVQFKQSESVQFKHTHVWTPVMVRGTIWLTEWTHPADIMIL